MTFLDDQLKANDASIVPGFTAQITNVNADRRWTIWRKSGDAANAATLFYKTQRLTFFLQTPLDPTKAFTLKIGGTAYPGPVDVDYSRGRLYFPLTANAEGQTVEGSYTAIGATVATPIIADPTNTVQWQDEYRANDVHDSPVTSMAAGLDAVSDSQQVPIAPTTNENNPAAFLDPLAGVNSPHKVWLFWNSTRNGTADIYSETIDPQFEPRPLQ